MYVEQGRRAFLTPSADMLQPQPAPDADMVFTTAETMDGSVGSYDILLVH